MTVVERSKAGPYRNPAMPSLAPRPSGYVCGACGEEHCECRPPIGDGAIARKRDPLDGLGAGIWRVVYVSLCVWAVAVTAWLVVFGKGA